MFTGLGHHTFIGCHHKHNSINSTNPGKHVFNEIAMPRHIHNPDLLPIWQNKPGKAQFNGHLPLLLLLQSVRVRASECRNQGGFSMINMTSGSNYAHKIPPAWMILASKGIDMDFTAVSPVFDHIDPAIDGLQLKSPAGVFPFPH